MIKLLESISSLLTKISNFIGGRIGKNLIEIVDLKRVRAEDKEYYGSEYDNMLLGAVTNLKISFSQFKTVVLLSILHNLVYTNLKISKYLNK